MEPPKKLYRVKLPAAHMREPINVRYFLRHTYKNDKENKCVDVIAVTEDTDDAVSGIIYRSGTPGREGLEWSRSRVKVMSLMLRDRGERMEASQHPDDEQLFGK